MSLSNIIIISVLSMYTIETQAQVYSDQLPTVYLTAVSKPSESSSPIELINNALVTSETSLKQAIKKGKKSPQDIVIIESEAVIIIDKTSYLKALKKAANKSETFQGFLLEIHRRLPELSDPLSSYVHMEALYTVVRSETFNGKLDALPTSIQWI